MNVVGHDAFLKAFSDPSLHVRISDKVPANVEEALCFTLNLEALDKSRDMEIKAMADRTNRADRSETCMYAKVVAKPGLVPVGTLMCHPAAASSYSDDVVRQLHEALMQPVLSADGTGTV